MTLPSLRLCFSLQTAICVSVLVMLTGCALRSPIPTEPTEPTQPTEVSNQLVQLPVPSNQAKAWELSVDPVPRTLAVEASRVEETPALNHSPVVKWVTAKRLVTSLNPSESVAYLLGEVDWAFEQNKLTIPKGQSAYYFITKILAKEPANPQALVALEKIVQRYYAMQRSSLKQGNLEQAQVYWSRAKWVSPKHYQLAAMQSQIDHYVASQSASRVFKSVTKKVPGSGSVSVPALAPAPVSVSGPVTRTPITRTQRLLLPIQQVVQQNELLAQWLVDVGQKTQGLKATMLIVAPKDAQARWVYKMMNAADPEQRIRANVKHSKPTRIEVTYSARKDELEVYSN